MEACLAVLAEQGVSFKTHTHPAVKTSEELEAHVADVGGAHTKNLFVSDKKHGAGGRSRATSRACA